MDRFINRKKQSNKNSIKLKKFLSAFIAKGFEDIKTNAFLQFISHKHKIPLSIITKAPKLQVGYVLLLPSRNNQTSGRSTSTRLTLPAYPP